MIDMKLSDLIKNKERSNKDIKELEEESRQLTLGIIRKQKQKKKIEKTRTLHAQVRNECQEEILDIMSKEFPLKVGDEYFIGISSSIPRDGMNSFPNMTSEESRIVNKRAHIFLLSSYLVNNKFIISKIDKDIFWINFVMGVNYNHSVRIGTEIRVKFKYEQWPYLVSHTKYWVGLLNSIVRDETLDRILDED